MKILANATVCDEGKLTGIERYALNITQELARIDDEVIVVRGGGASIGSSIIQSSVLSATSVLLGSNAYVFRSLWDQTAFRYLLLRNRTAIAYFPIPDGMFFPPVPQVVTIHDLHYIHFDKSIPECNHEISSLRRKIYQYKMPHILKNSSAVVAVSEATKHDIVTTFCVNPEKVHVIYNGYDIDSFRIIENPQPVLDRYGLENGNYFLFVGSILKHKNITRIVQAFALLKSNCQLVIAGACKDNDCFEDFLEVASEIGISGRLHYLEYVPDADLPYIYNGAITYLLPSLHEGFGVPIIEAMACGTPVITSNCSAMPEVAGDAALLVDPYSVDCIAAAMQEILGNPVRAEVLRSAGLERAKMFRWSNSAKKLYEVFRLVCES